MIARYALAGLLLMVGQSAYAQSDDEMAACVDRANGATDEMLDCGKAEIGKWDARLNAAYLTLLHRESGAGRTRLQTEQKAWLRHHLKETHRLAADPDTGSGAFMLSQGFELDDITKRTLALEQRVRDGHG
ncbi:lysozyme inhibitor LprI family protein [Mesorhizobium sp. RIZ17]|uniref:lysozyme inhibitor LprI family protein n=1 Tax=Mesorhizobium sp. RIZ17 TaxID=3132743 RepID=UPI003DA9F714